MPTTDQIIDSIENRLRELSAEIATLNAARAALQPASPNRVSQDRTALSRRNGRRRRDPKPRRSSEVVPAGKLELLLSNTGGLTTSELAERANGDRDQVLVLLRELEAAGRIRRAGQRRGTRWHAITDEERIRDRAAELAALSRRGS
jgi:hypothetical protein